MAELVQNLGSFVPDNLIVDGSVPILTKAVTLEAGQGTLQRGTVLGKVTKAINEVVGPGEAKGTIGTVMLGKVAKLGTYTLTCILLLLLPKEFRLSLKSSIQMVYAWVMQ